MASNKSIGVDGPLFKQALLGSLSWLSANHEEANRLNVFPVPDGDTGTNMLDRKSTRLNSSHLKLSRMPSSA